VLAAVLDGRLPGGTILVNWVGPLRLGWFSGMALGGHTMRCSAPGSAALSRRTRLFMMQTYDGGARLGTANVVLPALLVCFAGSPARRLRLWRSRQP
jgi:hypothetical protein